VPVYIYKCKDCRQTFEKKHGMFFELDRCDLCSGADIFKVPSIQTVTKVEKRSSKKPGKIVDEYIKDTKEEVKIEKRKLASEEI
jgi:hypothetical protein